jgi:hypothetical protein
MQIVSLMISVHVLRILTYMQSSSALDVRSGSTLAGLEKISLMTVKILPPQLMELFRRLSELKQP